jgi:hypothetical protein
MLSDDEVVPDLKSGQQQAEAEVRPDDAFGAAPA